MLRTIENNQYKLQYTNQTNIYGYQWHRLCMIETNLFKANNVHAANSILLHITGGSGYTVFNKTFVISHGHPNIANIIQLNNGGMNDLSIRVLGNDYNRFYIDILDHLTYHSLYEPNNPLTIYYTITLLSNSNIQPIHQNVSEDDIPNNCALSAQERTIQAPLSLSRKRDILYNTRITVGGGSFVDLPLSQEMKKFKQLVLRWSIWEDGSGLNTLAKWNDTIIDIDYLKAYGWYGTDTYNTSQTTVAECFLLSVNSETSIRCWMFYGSHTETKAQTITIQSIVGIA